MNRNRMLWVDLIRVIASILVVLVHSAAPILFRYNVTSHFNWWVANIFDSLARICVPLFFMISGYLLLSKEEPLKIFFQKRAAKVLVPAVAWLLFYLIWPNRNHLQDLALIDFVRILFKPTSFHLWFIYPLIGLYLLTPILRPFVQNSSRSTLAYFVILWLVVVTTLPYIEEALQVKSTFDLGFVSGYIGYFVLGYLLGTARILKRSFGFAATTFIGAWGGIVVGTGVLTIKGAGEFNDFFYGYLGPMVILLTSSTFVIIRNLAEGAEPSEKSAKLITTVSSLSFGVYLIHIWIMNYLNRTPLNVETYNALVSIPAMTLATLVASIAVIAVMKKIPVVRYLVP